MGSSLKLGRHLYRIGSWSKVPLQVEPSVKLGQQQQPAIMRLISNEWDPRCVGVDVSIISAKKSDRSKNLDWKKFFRDLIERKKCFRFIQKLWPIFRPTFVSMDPNGSILSFWTNITESPKRRIWLRCICWQHAAPNTYIENLTSNKLVSFWLG